MDKILHNHIPHYWQYLNNFDLLVLEPLSIVMFIEHNFKCNQTVFDSHTNFTYSRKWL
jgi:hypothetical protein